MRALRSSKNAYLNSVTVIGANSEVVEFTLVNGIWTPDYDNRALKLIDIKDGNGQLISWKYTNARDETETYDALGKLLEIKNKYGLVHTMHYNALGQIDTVTDSFGRQLSLIYNAQGQRTTMTDPASAIYSYTYDATGNLSTVTYPDGHTRTYVFEDSRYPSGLTGIVDENGKRFATWSYDADGRAISSEHAGGVEKVTVSFGTNTASVVNTQGLTRVYNTQMVNGINKPITVTENCGTNCTRTQTNTYDTNSNKTSSTDFNGTVTTYTYDLTRNLETSRTEASGTASARTISTQWHPTYRIPTQVNEPLKKTTYTHDANGNVLTRTEQATTDVNGSQGAAAAVVGTARTWTSTYNSVGQVLTSTGPRSDIVDRTTYTYDTQGNLASITNAAGHVTSLSGYDAHGHVGTITDPNGLVTTLTYHPRGWLLSRATTADGVTETTGYTYDGVGQMTKVTLPDNSQINYTYDDAHRLTKITDNVGNSINYTLDNVGNRINETTTDSTGNLSRQITRIYDALSRLQQVTGAAQ